MDKKTILMEARKYSCIAEWRAKSGSSYKSSKFFHKKFQDKCSKHMKKQKDSLGETLIGNIFSALFRTKCKKTGIHLLQIADIINILRLDFSKISNEISTFLIKNKIPYSRTQLQKILIRQISKVKKTKSNTHN